jgi:molybdopterin converting factor small subunit
MAGETSNGSVTVELHGFLADRLKDVGQRRGARTIVTFPLDHTATFASLMTRLVDRDDRYGLLFNRDNQSLPEHVEVVLNDRVLDLQGGLQAVVRPRDTLVFLPAHAGG